MSIKEKCEKCGKIYNKKKLRPNKLTGELWCKICLNRYGENKFNLHPNDFPLRSGNKYRVSKYKIDGEEKRILTDILKHNGLSEESAIKRINADNYLMKKAKKQKLKEDFKVRNDNELNKKKFVDGLK
ncbi:MAG: hypothetical protein WC758_08185 [Candidatus Woesearchaeota archaeon]